MSVDSDSSQQALPLNFLLVHGPMLGMLGKRQVEIYGTDKLEDIEGWIIAEAQEHDVEINCFQSESEGDLIKFLMSHLEDADGVIINPGAYSHYSYAIRDCLEMLPCPVVEVHLSNLYKRESFRHESVTGAACDGVIMGLGKDGYRAALVYLIGKVQETEKDRP